jgi:hypothetical protein
MACQRLPTRLTRPPRFIGVPGRTPTPRAPTPGVTTARATGRGRSTTPGLTTHPAGYATYWQYTTALASSVLAATNPVISSADNAIESFIVASSIRNLSMVPLSDLRLMQVKGQPALEYWAIRSWPNYSCPNVSICWKVYQVGRRDFGLEFFLFEGSHRQVRDAPGGQPRVSQDHRPERYAEQARVRPRKDEDRNHGDVVE